jgi:type I restriction enzyme S subunit
MPRADWEYISSSIFPYPSLPEQQKIASFLSTVDEKIQQLTQKKELLEQYKKGVMQQLFSGKLRFKNENGNDYPDWEFPHANILFKSISDKDHNSDLPILAITQDRGAIPRELIDYNMIVSEKSVASYKVVQVGDFIISLRSFQGGIEYSNYKGICSSAYNILRPTSDNVNKVFYKRYLKTEKYIRQLHSKLEGIRDGKMISFKYFSEIKLPFPCFKEQQKIATYLSSIDTKIKAVNNQITQSQSFKKGLLQQMFVAA